MIMQDPLKFDINYEQSPRFKYTLAKANGGGGGGVGTISLKNWKDM